MQFLAAVICIAFTQKSLNGSVDGDGICPQVSGYSLLGRYPSRFLGLSRYGELIGTLLTSLPSRT